MRFLPSCWQYVPVRNEGWGVLLGDIREVPLNYRQCLRMESGIQSVRWFGRPVAVETHFNDIMALSHISERITVFGRILPDIIPVYESSIWSRLDQAMNDPVYLLLPDWMHPFIAEYMNNCDLRDTSIVPLRFGDHGHIWAGPELSIHTGHQWGCMLKHLRHGMPVRTYLIEHHVPYPEYIPSLSSEQATQGLERLCRLVSRKSGRRLIQSGIIHIDPERKPRLHRLWMCNHLAGNSSTQPEKEEIASLTGINAPNIISERSQLRPARKWISYLNGPVLGLKSARVPKLDSIWVASANASDSTGFKDGAALIRALDIRGGGGIAESRADAITVAMAEAFERMSAVATDPIPGIRGRITDFDGKAYGWAELLPLSDWQKNNPGFRLSGNRVAVAGISLENREIMWLPMQCLGNKDNYFLPADYVLFGMDGEIQAHAHSDGLGACRTISGAVSSGLLELAERDALGMWWHGGAIRPPAPAEACGAAVTGRIIRDLKKQGRKLWMLDLANDLGVPVVAAISSDMEGRNILVGAAARFDYESAGRKAALEIVQMLPLLDQPRHRQTKEKREWFKMADTLTCPWLLPDKSQPASEVEVQNLQGLISRMVNAGLKPAAIRLPLPASPLITVKTVAPGLCSHRPVLGFERLDSIPLQLKWKTTKNVEGHPEYLQLYW